MTVLLSVALIACRASAAKTAFTDSASAEVTIDTTAAAAVPTTWRSIEGGVRIHATIVKGISSRTNRSGDTVSAVTDGRVDDARGKLVIPSGSPVVLTIEAIEPGDNRMHSDGRFSLAVTSVTVRGRVYPIVSVLTRVAQHMVERDGRPADEGGDALRLRDIVVSAGTTITFTLLRALAVAEE